MMQKATSPVYHEAVPPLFCLEREEKSILLGTHRVCSPEETLARVQPFLPSMGITRVADLTWLDEFGIPVFQAIRPNSRNLSTSQGKGITKALAKASAVMEAIESWHAEQPQLPSVRALVRDMAAHLPYALTDLPLTRYHLLHEASELEWFPAHRLDTARETYVPAALLRLNFVTAEFPVFPLFQISSNGLASGNTRDEAILHGLYEVIERDSLARARLGEITKRWVDPTTVDGGASGYVLEHLQRAQAHVEIASVTGATGIACFEVSLSSATYPLRAPGSGCHLDRDVALSRALTEAAQFRLSIISGARDDISRQAYRAILNRQPLRARAPAEALVDFHTIPSSGSLYLDADLQEVLQRLTSLVAVSPLVVDLTRQDMQIPVTFVVVPTLRFQEGQQ